MAQLLSLSRSRLLQYTTSLSTLSLYRVIKSAGGGVALSRQNNKTGPHFYFFLLRLLKGRNPYKVGGGNVNTLVICRLLPATRSEKANKTMRTVRPTVRQLDVVHVRREEYEEEEEEDEEEVLLCGNDERLDDEQQWHDLLGVFLRLDSSTRLTRGNRQPVNKRKQQEKIQLEARESNRRDPDRISTTTQKKNPIV